MDNYKIKIGIDAGVHTGICIIKEYSQTVEFYNTDFWGAIKELECRVNYDNLIVVIENPALIKCVFGAKGRTDKPEAYANKIGSNVGRVTRESELIIEYCKKYGIECKAVPPLKSGKKDATEFKTIYGIDLRLNQHCRDAFRLIFHNVPCNINDKKCIKK